MPSLGFDSTKGARPIALVKGGKYDGNVLYLHEDNQKRVRPPRVLNPSSFTAQLKGLKPVERVRLLNRLEEAKTKGVKPEQLTEAHPGARAIYERMLADDDSMNEVVLDDAGLFVPLVSPDPTKREVYYVAGQSGSGKSWIAKGLAEVYKKLFPDREVYLISKLDKDETLDALPFIKRLNIQTFIEDYPDIEEFRECLTIWDDFDTLTGPAEKVVKKLIDDLCIMGRHTVTSMAILSHYLNCGVCVA